MRTAFNQCDYQGVKNASTGVQFDEDLMNVEITDQISGPMQAQQTASTLLDFYFQPDSYQILKVVNKQDDVDQLNVSFTGALGDNLYTETTATAGRIVDGVDHNTLNVYFSSTDPTDGQISEYELMSGSDTRGLGVSYGDYLWVVVANPSTQGYEMQLQLSTNWTTEEDNAGWIGLGLAAAVLMMMQSF